MFATTQLNDVTFFVIDLIIAALVWRVDHVLCKIERNTRPPPKKHEPK